jgi:hypothetical protein
VHELEDVHRVYITRRGETVAVLISKAQYDRIQSRRSGFWQSYQSFRKNVNLKQVNIDPSEVWGNVRDKAPGREIEF